MAEKKPKPPVAPPKVPAWLADELGDVPPSSLPTARRRVYVAKLMESGRMSFRAVGAIFGVSHTMIRKDLKVAEEAWREEYAAQIGSQKALAVRRYENVIAEAMDAWFLSKQPTIEDSASKTTVGGGDDGKGGRTHQTAVKKKKVRTGDPRYLNVVIAAQTAINNINGIIVRVSGANSGESAAAGPDAPIASGSEKVSAMAQLLLTSSDDELAELLRLADPESRRATPVSVVDSVFDPDTVAPVGPAGEFIPAEGSGGES